MCICLERRSRIETLHRTLLVQLLLLGLLVSIGAGVQAVTADCPRDDRTARNGSGTEWVLDALSEDARFDDALAAQSCFRAPSQAADSIRSGESLVVDVRPQADFARARIPGSLNVPAHALWTRSFLRERRIVLTDAGFGQSQLLRLCMDLRERGFDQVSVLRGGLTAWRQTIGKLAGPEAVWSRLDLVSPRDFYREQKRAEIRLVDLTEPLPGSKGDDAQEGTGDTGSSSVDPAMIAHRLRFFAAAPPGDASSNRWYLVVSQDGNGYEAFGRAVTASAVKPVFFLSGGKDGYRSYLGQRAAMAHARQVGKPKGGCAGR